MELMENHMIEAQLGAQAIKGRLGEDRVSGLDSDARCLVREQTLHAFRSSEQRSPVVAPPAHSVTDAAENP